MKILILGPAGCGKSLLTGSFGCYLEKEGYKVGYMNLDPGVLEVPYKPDFDVREKFTVEKIMKVEGLGPNGAILKAMDLLAKLNLPQIEDDFVLLDTPGQLEPFVFRDSGRRIVEKLGDCCCAFLFDATIPIHSLPSLYLYSLATTYSLGVKTLNILNKVDLLEKRKIEELKSFLLNPQLPSFKMEGLRGEIDFEVAKMLRKFIPAQRIPLISAKTWQGFDELLTLIYEIKCVCGDLT